MPKPRKETCANCDREIGRLEEAYLWKNTPVCAECYAKLNLGSPVRPPTASLPESPAGPPTSPAAPPPQRAVQTVEQTSKTWKGLQLLGGVAMALGFGCCLLAGEENPGGTAVLLVGGFIVYMIARVGAWWHHA